MRPEKNSPKATVGSTACNGEPHNPTGSNRHLSVNSMIKKGAITKPGMETAMIAIRLET